MRTAGAGLGAESGGYEPPRRALERPLTTNDLHASAPPGAAARHLSCNGLRVGVTAGERAFGAAGVMGSRSRNTNEKRKDEKRGSPALQFQAHPRSRINTVNLTTNCKPHHNNHKKSNISRFHPSPPTVPYKYCKPHHKKSNISRFSAVLYAG